MKKNKRLKNWRINVVFLLLLVICAGIFYRLFSLQIIDYKFYAKKAENQHRFSQTLESTRGTIFMKDRFGDVHPLAINKEYYSVYVVPKEIEDKDKEGVSEKLAGILDMEKDAILKRVSKKDDPYEPVKSKLSDEEALNVKNSSLRGVYLSGKEYRHYPYDDIAATVVGFVNNPETEFIGQYGLEKFFDKELAGQKGSLTADKGVGGAIIFTGDRDYNPAVDGADLILTIDPNVQFKAEEVLKKAMEKWQAEKGLVIVADPKTGAIKALANNPSFNPNEYSKVEDIGVYVNSAVQGLFEPGSVMKPVTMAIGLDQGVITPDTKYIDEGIVQIGGYKIMNFDNEAHGEKTMRQVLELSLNTGVVFVQKKIQKPVFRDYFKNFGFGEKTGIDLPGEVSGNISNLESNRDINYATASFGQGVAITPMHLISAIGAIANKGKLMKPYIIDEFKSPDGKTKKTEPREVRQVVSPQSAEKVSSMMVDVVKNGFDKRASVEGYMIAGKTGTAQIADGKGGYSDEFIHSFIGFAPASDPKFLVLIRLEKPKGNRFASNTLSAFFGEMMNYLLSYYEVPPDIRTESGI